VGRTLLDTMFVVTVCLFVLFVQFVCLCLFVVVVWVDVFVSCNAYAYAWQHPAHMPRSETIFFFVVAIYCCLCTLLNT
jgi:hypothetical protein